MDSRGALVGKLLSPFQAFARSESAGGVLLIVAAAVAFAWANSPWAASYFHLLHAPAGLEIGGFALEKHLAHWVNDGLMVVFFLLVGLEIKREVLVGELSTPREAMLPMVAAVGGMAVPALIYAAVNLGSEGLRGWGIPMATDIAFALGVMSLLGDRVPVGLKVFLTALAIVDDLGAVLVIAAFYTDDVALPALGLSLAALVAVWAYGRLGGRSLAVFGAVGVIAWYFMLKSGVHATIAGVLLALAVPMRRAIGPEDFRSDLEALAETGTFEQVEARIERVEELTERAQSPLHRLEHALGPWVAFAILPLFALFNAGVAVGGGASAGGAVALGAALGLLLGKPLGVVGLSWLAVRAGWTELPRGSTWGSLGAVGLLTGIGFTMSLFVAGLAFDGASLDQAKIGVLGGSVVAAVAGLALLARATPGRRGSAGARG